jgi:EmrB/QacA subfamily drug resistance transporter
MMSNPAGETLPPASRREIQIVFAGLMLALALAALDNNIVSPALPEIVSQLHGLTHLSWIVTAFMLTSTITTPLYGKLSDLYGRKALFIVAITIFVAGSALCGLARSMTQLVLFRGLQGLGAGGLITLAQTTMADLIAPRERGKYQGLFVAVFAICSVAGPLLGGFITQLWSWRWIFYVNVPIGAVAFLLILFGLRRHHQAVNHRIDYLGALLLTVATTSLLLALTWGGSVYPWGSPLLISLGLATVVFLALFLGCERRATEPILPLRLFGNGVFVVAGGAMGLTMIALAPMSLLLPTYFQVVLGATPLQSGLLISPLMGGLIVASIIGGHLVSATGRYKFYPLVGLGVAIGAYLVLAWGAMMANGVVMVACLVVFGFGYGLVMPILTVAIQNAVAHNDLGVATSTAAFLRSLGLTVGVALSGTVWTMELYRLLPETAVAVGASEHSFAEHSIQQIKLLPQEQRAAIVAAYQQAIATTLLAGAGFTVLGLIAVVLLPELQLRSAHEPILEESQGPINETPPLEPMPGT